MLVYGFLLAAEPSARKAVASVARAAAWGGLAGFLVLAGAGLAFDPEQLLTGHAAVDVAWRALKGITGWLLLLAIVALVGRLRVPAVPRWVNDAVLPVYVLHQTVVVVLAWRILAWDGPPAVQLLALIAGSLVGTLALYALVRRVPGAGVLLGQRKRSSSRARRSAAAPGPSPAVT